MFKRFQRARFYRTEIPRSTSSWKDVLKLLRTPHDHMLAPRTRILKKGNAGGDEAIKLPENFPDDNSRKPLRAVGILCGFYTPRTVFGSFINDWFAIPESLGQAFLTNLYGANVLVSNTHVMSRYRRFSMLHGWIPTPYSFWLSTIRLEDIEFRQSYPSNDVFLLERHSYQLKKHPSLDVSYAQVLDSVKSEWDIHVGNNALELGEDPGTTAGVPARMFSDIGYMKEYDDSMRLGESSDGEPIAVSRIRAFYKDGQVIGQDGFAFGGPVEEGVAPHSMHSVKGQPGSPICDHNSKLIGLHSRGYFNNEKARNGYVLVSNLKNGRFVDA